MTFIEACCTSRIQTKVIRFFSEAPSAEIGCRPLATRLNEDAGALWYKLREMTRDGFLKKSGRNYRLNDQFPASHEVQKIALTKLDPKLGGSDG